MRNPDGPVTGRPPVRAERGMVATSHYLASGAGLAALRRGGTAVDAAIAANAVLCVAYPHMAGLGGDAFALVKSAGGEVEALNASGPAAALATRDYYRERGHRDEIPSRGLLAALTVPGAVDGWRLMHERYGRLGWDELLVDAVHLARAGVPVTRSVEEWTAADASLLRAHESAAAVFLPGGSPPREGDRLRNEALATTLQALAEDGPRRFYDGPLAERLCRQLGEGSPLRADDLGGYRASWVDPVTGAYRGRAVVEMPPNTQGFAALEVLHLLDGLDVRALGDGTADYYHHVAEAVKLAFADRDAWLSDPEHVDIPLERLLSSGYADERRGLIDPEQAMVMEEVRTGVAAPHPGGGPGGGDTCYLCAVDDDGLVVSLIQSVYHDYGSAVVAGDTGVLLQNRGSHFSLDEDHPNRLEPGKRTFHTLVPGLLLDDAGEVDTVFGAMGGEGQPQTHAALLTRLVDFGYDVQQAIEAPRWLMGRTWGTESRDLSVEARVGDGVIRELERRGQPVKVLAAWDDNMGHAQVIRVDAAGGFLEGGRRPQGRRPRARLVT